MLWFWKILFTNLGLLYTMQVVLKSAKPLYTNHLVCKIFVSIYPFILKILLFCITVSILFQDLTSISTRRSIIHFGGTGLSLPNGEQVKSYHTCFCRPKVQLAEHKSALARLMRPRSALARQIKPVAVIPRQMSVSDVAARKKTTNWILLREILISFVFSAVQIHG